MARGLFVTGTDTGVGKTLVSCALLMLLREEGLNAAGFKPVSCGMDAGRFADAELLREAAGGVQTLDAVSPLRSIAPLAPTLAAQAEGRAVELDRARKQIAELRNGFDAVVAEGVGGWLVPLDEKTLAADFAAELGWPVLVVGRAELGTINHTLLTLREIQRAGLKAAGVVLSESADGAPQPGSAREIERIGGVPVLSVLPRLNGTDTEKAAAAARVLKKTVRASALLP